jgi:hypothetical protein
LANVGDVAAAVTKSVARQILRIMSAPGCWGCLGFSGATLATLWRN